MRTSLLFDSVDQISIGGISQGYGLSKLTAQPVRTITPLLPACDTIGRPVPSALNKLPIPSHRMPPWMRLLNSVPSTSTPDISAVARMSGMQLTPWQMNIISSGKTNVPSTDSSKVCVHRNVNTGAESIFSRDQ